MINVITVDQQLADSVDKELHGVWVPWQYLPLTTSYYDNKADETERKRIDDIRIKYGPVNDTQKFSYSVYNRTRSDEPPFLGIRRDPSSFYNKRLPNLAKLVDHLQSACGLEDYKIVRLIINIQTMRPEWSMNALHPDFSNPQFVSLLYYVNDSDGDTYFFEGTECIHQQSPKKGAAVVYPSCMLHAGSTPIENETRVVVNMGFEPKNPTK